ncbi:MAG: NupC/NupG family nucleoside CNT transporter [Rhodospirillaceae bacterium]
MGVAVILGLAWLLSERRKDVVWSAIAKGVALQFVIALLLTKVPMIQRGLEALNGMVNALMAATRAGTSFVFGYVGGGDVPWANTNPGANFVFAFQALPLILIISAISGLLFYWNIIPPIVRAFAWVLRRTIGVGGPAGIAVTMNIFVGMVEAPLVIRPYLRTETRSGLFIIMTAGMAMVAGTVMVLYATLLDGLIPNPIGQILTASIMAAPATIVIAFIIMPEDPALFAAGSDPGKILLPPSPGNNMMSVITKATIDGLQIFANVVGMLIVLVALVAIANSILNVFPDVFGGPLTLQRAFGWVLSPMAWLLGIPWDQAPTAGALLGTKMVLNELIAYTDMSKLPVDALSERSRLIMTYALCGFANFSSIGITIGGIAAMVPERRPDIIELAPKAMLAGTLATCLSGAVIGILT